MYIYIHRCVYMYIYTYVYTHTYTSLSLSLFIYIYIYIYIYDDRSRRTTARSFSPGAPSTTRWSTRSAWTAPRIPRASRSCAESIRELGIRELRNSSSRSFCGKFPMDLGIPPLAIKNQTESKT